MKKTAFLLNVLLIAATLVSAVYYYTHGGLFLKGLTSSGFALLGVVNLAYTARTNKGALPFAALMAAGLLFSMAGDIVLNLNFIPGALIFALGHLLYFTAYCAHTRFRPSDLVPIGVMFALSVMILQLLPLDFGSALMEWVCMGYGLVISCMLGKAAANFIRERTLVSTLLAVGSILFYFSDLMLCLGKFGSAPDITDALCLFTYYPAQCLLAHTVIHRAK